MYKKVLNNREINKQRHRNPLLPPTDIPFFTARSPKARDSRANKERKKKEKKRRSVFHNKRREELGEVEKVVQGRCCCEEVGGSKKASAKENAPRSQDIE